MNIIYSYIITNTKNRISALKLTQKEIGGLTGISQPTISLLLRTVPNERNIGTWLKIAEALGLKFNITSTAEPAPIWEFKEAQAAFLADRSDTRKAGRVQTLLRGLLADGWTMRGKDWIPPARRDSDAAEDAP